MPCRCTAGGRLWQAAHVWRHRVRHMSHPEGFGMLDGSQSSPAYRPACSAACVRVLLSCRWGGTSVFAGLLVTNYGLKAGFVAYFLASIVALAPTAMLRVQVRLIPCLGQGSVPQAGAWLACTTTGWFRMGLVRCIFGLHCRPGPKRTWPVHDGQHPASSMESLSAPESCTWAGAAIDS